MAKRLLAWCLTSIMALSSSGCMPKSTEVGNTPSGESINISLSFWEPSTNQEMEKAFTTLAQKYNELHPNTNIKLLSQPVSGYQEWIKAQFAANNAPVIQYNHPDTLWEQYNNGLIIDIGEALDSPNPYADNEIWRDIFIDGKMDAAAGYKAKPTFSVPLSGLGLAYFYNTEIYNRLGLKAPNTWDEFMQNCEIIKNDGINPIAFMAQKVDSVQWLAWYLSTGLFGDAFLGDENINVNGDNNIDGREAARAIHSGYFSLTNNAEFRSMYETFLKMLEQYAEYAQNSTGLDESGAKAQFLSGKAAHIMSGSWDIQSFISGEGKAFETSAFAFPEFTTANSPYAGDNMVITSVQPIGITKTAEQSPEMKEAAIDFLLFITAPDNYKTFVETTYAMPVVKNLDIDSVFTAFTTGSRPQIPLFSYASKKAEFTSLDAITAILAGEKVNMDTIISKVQKANEMVVEDTMERYGVSAENDFGVADVPSLGGMFKKSAE